MLGMIGVAAVDPPLLPRGPALPALPAPAPTKAGACTMVFRHLLELDSTSFGASTINLRTRDAGLGAGAIEISSGDDDDGSGDGDDDDDDDDDDEGTSPPQLGIRYFSIILRALEAAVCSGRNTLIRKAETSSKKLARDLALASPLSKTNLVNCGFLWCGDIFKSGSEAKVRDKCGIQISALNHRKHARYEE